MKRNMGLLIALCLFLITFAGCTSEEDKATAQKVVEQINNIGDITLEKENMIYVVQQMYNSLTSRQKGLVDNYEILSEAVSEMENLLIEEEIKSDPTSAITQDELIGIWEEDDASDVHRGYLYFTTEGYLYYMGSKDGVTRSDFTGEYKISSSYELGEYNRETKVKEGSFYCIPKKTYFKFYVSKNENGEIVLEVLDKTIGGSYHKKG